MVYSSGNPLGIRPKKLKKKVKHDMGKNKDGPAERTAA
jgi:hypothetical protein